MFRGCDGVRVTVYRVATFLKTMQPVGEKRESANGVTNLVKYKELYPRE